MKASVSQKNLRDGLNSVLPAIPRSSSVPILTNVMIEAKGGSLWLTGNNYEMSVTAKVPSLIDQDGGILVPARSLAEMVNAVPSDTRIDLEVTEDGRNLRFVTESDRSNFIGDPVKEYPRVPDIGPALSFKVDSDAMREAIDKTLFSVEKREGAREILQGVKFKVVSGGSTLTMVSTDTFRLTEVKRATLEKAEQTIEGIFPTGLLQQVRRMLYGSEVEILYNPESTRLQMNFANGHILMGTAKSGTYPDYESIIPPQYDIVADISVRDLKARLRAARVFAASPYTIRLEFFMGEVGPVARLSNKSSALGDHFSEIDLRDLTGRRRVAFSGYRLQHVVNVMAGDMIRLEMQAGDGPAPVVIRDSGDKQFTHVLVPLSVSWPGDAPVDDHEMESEVPSDEMETVEVARGSEEPVTSGVERVTLAVALESNAPVTDDDDLDPDEFVEVDIQPDDEELDYAPEEEFAEAYA